MMKRMIACALGLALLLAALAGCGSSFSQLGATRIEGVTIWTHAASWELREDELFEFVRLYNVSSYGGKATGNGGTPDFGISFQFVDSDKHFGINEFGKKFEVYADGSSFYLESTELYEFVKGLATELDASN